MVFRPWALCFGVDWNRQDAPGDCLAVAACQQRKRVRFTTAAELVNELVEARQQRELSRIVNRWARYELIVVDEFAYVAMPDTAATPEHEHAARKRIFGEFVLAKPRQRVNAFASIDRLDGDQHAHLRRDLGQELRTVTRFPSESLK